MNNIIMYSLLITAVTLLLLVIGSKIVDKCNDKPEATLIVAVIGVVILVCVLIIASSKMAMHRATEAMELVTWLL